MTGSVWIGGMRACAVCFDADHVRDHGHPGLCHVKGCRKADGGECAISYAGAEEPMDTKPLRQEDYQAMAERARRAEAELAQLKAKDQEAPPVSRIALVLMLAMLVLGVVVGYATSAGGLDPALKQQQAQPTSTAKRTTPCYFIRRVDKSNEPWNEDWRVIRSDCSGCENNDVRDTYGKIVWFDNKDKAWNFIQDWKVEACK